MRANNNLFSITQELSKGAKLGSDDVNNITLNYPDGSKITFDWCIKTRDGLVGGVDVVQIINDVAKLSQDEMKGKPIKSSAKDKKPLTSTSIIVHWGIQVKPQHLLQSKLLVSG